MIQGRFIEDAALQGFENMAIDSALVESLLSGFSLPTFRTYSWSPVTLSLGYHQPLSEVNLSAVHLDGVGLVRRPTGGRAVFHAGELTYSVVLPLGDKAPSEWYDLIHQTFHEAFLRQTIDTGYTHHHDDFKSVYQGISAVPCFISSAKSELLLNGKKLVGSAQRIYGPVLLQHGSILLDRSHLDIVKYLTFKKKGEAESLTELLTQKSTSIGQENLNFSVSRFISDIKELLPMKLGIDFLTDSLLSQEQELVYHLSKKYRKTE
ncbi:MAG: lipoate--protein ligase family protein [Bacteroidetes bacterium]|nr:lipoate--protein ligase family protein [Bacteroidota bacterium]